MVPVEAPDGWQTPKRESAPGGVTQVLPTPHDPKAKGSHRVSHWSPNGATQSSPARQAPVMVLRVAVGEQLAVAEPCCEQSPVLRSPRVAGRQEPSFWPTTLQVESSVPLAVPGPHWLGWQVPETQVVSRFGQSLRT